VVLSRFLHYVASMIIGSMVECRVQGLTGNPAPKSNG
jgi:hypothetical protein